jgi:hypothetical protein
MMTCPVAQFAKEIRWAMKKLLLAVVLAGLGCFPNGYRGNDAYPSYQDRMAEPPDRHRWEEGPYHWPLVRLIGMIRISPSPNESA